MSSTRDPETGKFVSVTDLNNAVRDVDPDNVTIVEIDTPPAPRLTLTNRVANERCRVPRESLFMNGDYLLGTTSGADNLREIMSAVISRYPEHMFLRDAFENERLIPMWRKKAPVKADKVVFGQCVRVGTRERFFSEADWLVIISADAVAFMTNEQLEALIYHELKHLAWDDEKEIIVPVGHDVELFRSEIDRYGLWMPTLRATAETFQQLPIPIDDTDGVS